MNSTPVLSFKEILGRVHAAVGWISTRLMEYQDGFKNISNVPGLKAGGLNSSARIERY